MDGDEGIVPQSPADGPHAERSQVNVRVPCCVGKDLDYAAATGTWDYCPLRGHLARQRGSSSCDHAAGSRVSEVPRQSVCPQAEREAAREGSHRGNVLAGEEAVARGDEGVGGEGVAVESESGGEGEGEK